MTDPDVAGKWAARVRSPVQHVFDTEVRQLLERLAALHPSEAGELILAEENGRWTLAHAA